MKLVKSEHKLKHQYNNDLIKPVLYVSGIKLLKLVQTPLRVFFLNTLVVNFSFSRKIITSKKGKQPSFSFSI